MRRDYAAAIRRLHDLGVMINGSFVFGMDGDDGSVFERTVEWAIEQGIETATFHILTPYPGTALYRRMADQGRLTVHDWDLYDTRHAVFRPARMTAEELEYGYQLGVPRVLPVGLDRARRIGARRSPGRPAPSGVFRRVEEVRAAVGFHHSRQTRGDDAAGARDDPQRIRQALGRSAGLSRFCIGRLED